jgi:hypothetical protein
MKLARKLFYNFKPSLHQLFKQLAGFSFGRGAKLFKKDLMEFLEVGG